ncbi:MAG: Uncharacterised protein [Flavobacteriia bacterium]|nr:MAG: Uncharacterised protein [Flavobacteriia bacterium]
MPDDLPPRNKSVGRNGQFGMTETGKVELVLLAVYCDAVLRVQYLACAKDLAGRIQRTDEQSGTTSLSA